MILREPRKQPRQISHEQSRVDRHVENRGSQREPGLLKSPEIAHGTAHPCVVAAFEGQRAREFADHEGGRETPEQRGENQEENRAAVSGAVNDVFNSVGAARDHKEGGGDQRPERQASGFLFLWGKQSRREWMMCGASCCQLRWLPPRTTHSQLLPACLDR